MRPATDAQWDDAKVYRLLSDAQVQVMAEVAARFPRLLMSAPVALATADGGLTFQSTQLDGNGSPIYPMGHAEVYVSSAGVLGREVYGTSYTDPGGVVLEGNTIRLPRNVALTTGADALYMRCVVMPDQISASVQPILKPPYIRALITYRALVLYANSGGRQDPRPYQDLYDAAWNGSDGTGGFLAMLTTQYRRSSEAALTGVRWWREWQANGGGAMGGSGGAISSSSSPDVVFYISEFP